MANIPCKHTNHSECDELCECLCEACQNIFEKMWIERATNDKLCVDCGVPMNITVQSLMETQYTHFFQPCNMCEPNVKTCLAKANLCEACREPLMNDICVRCKCNGTDACVCIQCSTYKKQMHPFTQHSSGDDGDAGEES